MTIPATIPATKVAPMTIRSELLSDPSYAVPDRFPWSRPYHGVQHCGNGGTQDYWATVEDHGTFAVLTLWTPGCGFRAEQTHHDTAEAARSAGRSFVLANNRGDG